MPQVIDLIYKVAQYYKICHNYTIVDSFLWKETDKGLKLYTTNFGGAQECPGIVRTSEGLRSLLIANLSLFNRSFMKPYDYEVDAPEGVAYLAKPKYNDWKKTFLKSEENAVKKDKRWSELFENIEEFDYGYILYLDSPGKN